MGIKSRLHRIFKQSPTLTRFISIKIDKFYAIHYVSMTQPDVRKIIKTKYPSKLKLPRVHVELKKTGGWRVHDKCVQSESAKKKKSSSSTLSNQIFSILDRQLLSYALTSSSEFALLKTWNSKKNFFSPLAFGRCKLQNCTNEPACTELKKPAILKKRCEEEWARYKIKALKVFWLCTKRIVAPTKT